MGLLNFTTVTQYVGETCFKCSVPFALALDTYNQCKSSGKSFFCPNGHEQVYRESNETRLKRELEQKNAAIESERRRTEWARADARRMEKQRNAYKGVVTKTKNRISNGVCPCCTRSFQNLKRHMQHKHPGYKNLEET